MSPGCRRTGRLKQKWTELETEIRRSAIADSKNNEKRALTQRVGPVLDLCGFGEVRLLFHFHFCHRLRSAKFERVSLPEAASAAASYVVMRFGGLPERRKS